MFIHSCMYFILLLQLPRTICARQVNEKELGYSHRLGRRRKEKEEEEEDKRMTTGTEHLTEEKGKEWTRVQKMSKEKTASVVEKASRMCRRKNPQPLNHPPIPQNFLLSSCPYPPTHPSGPVASMPTCQPGLASPILAAHCHPSALAQGPKLDRVPGTWHQHR